MRVFLALTLLFCENVFAAAVCELPVSRGYKQFELADFFTPDQVGGWDKIYDSSGWSGILSSQNINNFGVESGSQLVNMASTLRFNMPVARILTSIELLKISKGYSKAPSDSYLETVYDDSGSLIDLIQYRCAAPNNETAKISGQSFVGSDARIPNEYGKYILQIYADALSGSAIGIAGLIVHEAHHRKNAKSLTIIAHDAENQCSSCDSSYEYKGANHYQLLFHLHYGLYSINGNKYMRDESLLHARTLQAYRFIKIPDIKIPLSATR